MAPSHTVKLNPLRGFFRNYSRRGSKPHREVEPASGISLNLLYTSVDIF